MNRTASQSGFTLVELLVSIAIFSVMTGIVLARYNTYNTNAPFANASEDVVLALRQAQVYGVGVKGCGAANPFDCGYGVYFSTAAPSGFKIFADTNNNKTYDLGTDTVVDTISWKGSIVVSSVKCGGGACASNVLNVTFKRPNPAAAITDSAGGAGYSVGQIVISNGLKYSTTTISSAGQISLQ